MFAPIRPSPIIPSCIASSFFANRASSGLDRTLRFSLPCVCGNFSRLRLLRASHRRKPPRNALLFSPARQSGGKFFQQFQLPPPKTTSSGSSAALETFHHVFDVLAPFFLPMRSRPANARRSLRRSLAVRKMAQFHGLDDAVDNERGAQAGAQAEEQHLAAFGSCPAPASRHR